MNSISARPYGDKRRKSLQKRVQGACPTYPHCKLYIRIPRPIWNSVRRTSVLKLRPNPTTAMKSDSEKKTDTESKSDPEINTITKEAEPTQVPKAQPPSASTSGRNPLRRRPCGIKISRWEYGGPKRAKKGIYKNKVTLSQPCGEASCATCQVYNRHLIMELPPLLSHPEGPGNELLTAAVARNIEIPGGLEKKARIVCLKFRDIRALERLHIFDQGQAITGRLNMSQKTILRTTSSK